MISAFRIGSIADEVEEPNEKDPAAQELGKKGGKARAEKLSPATRSSIAKQAANARWSIPKVIYGAPDKPLLIGDVGLQCYVLEDETRVLTRTALFSGLNMKHGSYHTGSYR